MARRKLRPPGQVFVIFMVVALLSTGALAVLSWQLLEQDRLLETQRHRGLLEGGADNAVANMKAALAQLDLVLERRDAASLAGVSVVSISAAGTTVTPASSLLFLPTRPAMPDAEPASFAAATAFEFQAAKLPQARAIYEDLATHASPSVRATALARLAAVQLKLGDLASALRSYDVLATLDDVGIGGLPGGFVASAGRASALAAHGTPTDLRAAATALAADLARARWPLLQSEYDFYSAQVARWLGASLDADVDSLARADAAAWLWTQRASLPASGRRLNSQTRGSAVIVWRTSADGITAAIGGPTFLGTFVGSTVPAGFIANLRDLEGKIALGAGSAGGNSAVRVASSTVPWSLELFAAPSPPSSRSSPRRGLVLLVVTVTILALGAGWYFISRALGRERRVARLQNDFVAAVSHEFRSPLTSLAHVSELLAHDRFPTEVQRRQAYAVMVGDTARLRDMVEHLLDFGRFDAGAAALRLENVDVDTTVAEVVNDARHRVAAQGFTIEFSGMGDPITARVDKDALSRAIWNLIDNAVKYSPECRTVWVTTAKAGDRVLIAVRDQGLGIPAAEQAEIFGRFVRGEESKARRIKGTGIGLALVRQIVDAHGGEIELTSVPGQGSQFVVSLRVAGGVA